MRPIISHLLAIYVASLVGAQLGQQEALFNIETMAQLTVDKVPGHNDAIYGPVPKNDQIFKVEFLEIAPTPIVSYDYHHLFHQRTLLKLIC